MPRHRAVSHADLEGGTRSRKRTSAPWLEGPTPARNLGNVPRDEEVLPISPLADAGLSGLR